MKYLKGRCGCITLVDSDFDATNIDKVGLGHEFIVFGCGASGLTFRAPQYRNLIGPMAPAQVEQYFTPVELDSPEGRELTKKLGNTIRAGKCDSQLDNRDDFLPTLPSGIRVINLSSDPVDEQEAQSQIKSLFEESQTELEPAQFRPPLLSSVLGLLLSSSPSPRRPDRDSSRLAALKEFMGQLGEFPNTGKFMPAELVALLELPKSLTARETDEFVIALERAQALHRADPISHENELDALREQCAGLMAKALADKLRTL